MSVRATRVSYMFFEWVRNDEQEWLSTWVVRFMFDERELATQTHIHPLFSGRDIRRVVNKSHSNYRRMWLTQTKNTTWPCRASVVISDKCSTPVWVAVVDSRSRISCKSFHKMSVGAWEFPVHCVSYWTLSVVYDGHWQLLHMWLYGLFPKRQLCWVRSL